MPWSKFVGPEIIKIDDKLRLRTHRGQSNDGASLFRNKGVMIDEMT